VSTLSVLPAVNAGLNAISALLILLGWVCIRRRRTVAHRLSMLGAVGASGLFLLSYLVYHFVYGSTRFTGQGLGRTLYFLILGSHTVLATALVVLVPTTLYWAIRARFDRHARLARWTVPIGLYVSVTGVAIYLMLYRLS
jgi:putative membrane protein